jgi:uncharacterized damage-inducible protein DinB
VTRSDLADAFDHHVWATLRVIDVCASLSQDELASPIPGTYGSILDTVRHTVGADAWYLFVITEGRLPRIEEEAMELDQLRVVMDGHREAWLSVLGEHPDTDADIVAHRRDGTSDHATVGIRLAQAVHHGTDHRSHICTGLTALGVEPPEIDVWAFGEQSGQVFETPSP